MAEDMCVSWRLVDHCYRMLTRFTLAACIEERVQLNHYVSTSICTYVLNELERGSHKEHRGHGESCQRSHNGLLVRMSAMRAKKRKVGRKAGHTLGLRLPL